MTNWQQIRLQVLERDGFVCQHCGKTNENLDIHHVIPKRLGGLDVLNNLVSLCNDKCHTLLELRRPSIKEVKQLESAISKILAQKMVRIDDDVHAELTELGTKNESYSDVIRRLIKSYRGMVKK